MRRMFYVEHHPVNFIAEHFSVHHSTVTRAINQDYNRNNPTRALPLAIQEFYPLIQERLEKYPKIRATRIHSLLKEKGFSGSYTTVIRAVRAIRPKISRAFVPVEVISGEEAQMDWAHFGSIKIGDATRKVYCFVMTLSWSRASWAELTMDMTTETLLRCHARAFEYFGGIPTRVLYDNMKTVVIERVGDAIRFNPVFLEFSSWYCYEPRVCDPYQPQQKGRVERFIRTIRDGWFNDYDMVDIEKARYDFRLWLYGSNTRKWPGGKHTTIEERFKKEQNDLRPGPTPQFPLGTKIVRSGRTPLIKFDLNQYTIDPNYVRNTLTLYYDMDEIKLYAGDILVANHSRCWDRDRIIRKPEHIEKTYKLASKGQSLSLTRHLLVEEMPLINDLLSRCQSNDLPSGQIIKTLTDLRSTYGSKLLSDAIVEALEKEKTTPEAVTSIIMRRHSEEQNKRIIPLSLPDRPGVSDLFIKSHDLSEYDNI